MEEGECWRKLIEKWVMWSNILFPLIFRLLGRISSEEEEKGPGIKKFGEGNQYKKDGVGKKLSCNLKATIYNTPVIIRKWHGKMTLARLLHIAQLFLCQQVHVLNRTLICVKFCLYEYIFIWFVNSLDSHPYGQIHL